MTLGWGLVALLAVSVLVALVELLRRDARPGLQSPSPLRTVRVDVDVDAMAVDPGPRIAAGDPEARRAALAEVLHRMQQPGPDAPWIETAPMVLTPQDGASSERG